MGTTRLTSPISPNNAPLKLTPEIQLAMLIGEGLLRNPIGGDRGGCGGILALLARPRLPGPDIMSSTLEPPTTREASMTDREINSMLWRAFLLGARVMAGAEISASDMTTIARVAREIAESETTLEDPTALAKRFPEMAETFQRLGTLNIRNNRDLAKRIYAGFEIATEVKE